MLGLLLAISLASPTRPWTVHAMARLGAQPAGGPSDLTAFCQRIAR